MSLNYRKI